MPRTQLSPYEKLDAGETIEFCPVTQSWWPKGRAPEGAQVTTAATLDKPTVYAKAVGLRTRDIQFTRLADEAETAAPPEEPAEETPLTDY